MKRVPSTPRPRILVVCLLSFSPLLGGACSSANVAASGTGGSGGTGGGGGSIIGPLTDGGTFLGSGSPMTCDVANYGVMFTKGECPHDCSGQASNTYISGKVYDPAGLRTIYGAVVYIPSNPSQVVDPMPFAGVQCTTCANFTYAGPPVPQAHAVTAPDGSFKIGIDPSTGTDWAGGNPVPVGSDIPLVIQIGKWRRMVTIAVVACQDNQVDKSLTSLPSSRGPDGQNGQGSLPRIAISVGDADRLQCLFARMGIAGSEFTSGPTGTGAINLYKDDTASFTGTVSWPSSTTLWDTADHLKQYDIVMLGCQGSQATQRGNKDSGVISDASKQAMVDYANAGGKVFAEHYQQAWLASFPPLKTDLPTKAGVSCLKDPICGADMATVCTGNSNAVAGSCQLCSFNCTNLAAAPHYTASAPFGEVANWILSSGEIDASGSIGSLKTGAINTTFPSGLAFSQWLPNQPPSPLAAADTGGNITIESDMKPAATATIDPPATPWISIPGYADYFTFNTPVGAAEASQCGRVAYTDVHVASGAQGSAYYDPKPSASPSECLNHPLLNQEKAIEFMIFDLSHCTISDSNNLGGIIIP